jgi:hypothetical protein
MNLRHKWSRRLLSSWAAKCWSSLA